MKTYAACQSRAFMTGVFTFVAGEHFLLCVILPSTHLKLKGRGEEICMWTIVLENNFNAWKEVSFFFKIRHLSFMSVMSTLK